MRRWGHLPGIAVLAATVAGAGTGCISTAEFRKLEYEVNKLKVAQQETRTEGVADVRTEVEALRADVARLEGRLDVAEHETRNALEEARAARLAASSAPAAEGEPSTDAAAPGKEPVPEGEPAPGATSVELGAYREAYDAWRTDDNAGCIGRFSAFLQSYPASQYADDAAYWLADCHYKDGDYKNAILRFDDVANRYPKSDKAPEALYRQGEALLRLGPGFAKAARGAFQRILDEYPGSRRAKAAAEQLELLGSGR